jgi:acetyl-CoA carboxylase carboxyl transferase subunit beta
MPPDDPLKFSDSKPYKDRISVARKKTGQRDAMMIAKGKIQNIDVTVGAQNFSFIGGAVGIASGEIFIQAVDHAIKNKTPLIFFSSSGGQKLQESGLALQMMAKTTLGVNELKRNNLPFIVCMTNPTAGGVTASWASLGDVIMAEKGCTISFAGARVIKDTVREELPPGFQTAEYLLDHGQVDAVLERKYINSAIGTLLNVLLKKAEAQAKQESNVTVDKSLQAVS